MNIERIIDELKRLTEATTDDEAETARREARGLKGERNV